MTATESQLPLTGGQAKRAYVRGLFAEIAPRYDLLNHVLSLNVDRRWRRQAVEQLDWQRAPGGSYLDLCAGTLDLAAELGNQPAFTGRVVGADFVPEMLARGMGKSSRVSPAAADALDLPFADATFDGATVGFGVRNLMDLDAGLREAARVLKPGARLVVLELAMPAWQPLRGIYLTYFRRILPGIGRLVSKHRTAYDWLPASVENFPEPPAFAECIREAGFDQVRYDLLWGGIAAVHVGFRKES